MSVNNTNLTKIVLTFLNKYDIIIISAYADNMYLRSLLKWADISVQTVSEEPPMKI